MKFFFTLILLSSSLTAFSQNSCESRLSQARQRLADAREQLRICESGSSGRGEVEQLRIENLRLRDLNRRLQQRLDQYEGGPTDSLYFCTAGCTFASGNIDNRFLIGTSGYTQLEADLSAKQSVQATYGCSYAPKTYKCESIFANAEPRNFCTAACKTASGNADQRFIAGARGRNVTEAETTALQEVQKQYGCSYGPRIIDCR